MNIIYKRIIGCYALAAVMLFICVLRVAAIVNQNEYSQAAKNETSRVVTLNFSRGTIFDCNMDRITNKKNVIYAVIFNEPSAIASLNKFFSGLQIQSIINEIKAQGFALRTVSRKIDAQGIYCFSAFLHADDSLIAKHTVGYIDSKGEGVSGIEAAYNSLLKGDEKNTVTFSLDGRGKVLSGERPTLNYDYAKENSGVKLTIDTKIQQIVEQEAMAIETGAIVVTEIQTGKIRAIVSRPDYKLSNLAAAVENKNQPFLNRALCTYNIGSVFKPYVAAAGYEKGVKDRINCTGYANIDGLNFSCHKLSGHGNLELSEALKFSCNSYFYNYIQKLGAEDVVNLALRSGFESSIYLADGLSGKKGSLGKSKTTKLSKRALANFSIGQGELMLSPLAITNFYMAAANGGKYRTPSLVEGTVKDGKVAEEKPTASTKVMSKQTADQIKNDLALVLSEGGTGESARPTLTTAAGKTGTAQTGVIKNGKKTVNSWFCGFFPFEEPEYAVTVLWENSSGSVGHTFASIADGITLSQHN